MSAHKRVKGTGLLFVAPMLWAGGAWADFALNMPRGVTPISREVYDLHMLIVWACVAIGIVVFGVMLYSIVKHRKSVGAKPAQFHESTALEIFWTIIPFLILIGMAIPATRTLIAIEDTSNADMTIKVTGYQWKWQYEYLEDGLNFFSTLDADSNRVRQLNSGKNPRSVDNYLLEVDNPVVVPVGKKVRFLLTANDVLHAWWVPALGMKRDAIPGYINEMWAIIEEPGTYRGQCAELCGRDHAFMPVVMVAVEEDDYRAWVSEQQGALQIAEADADREWTRDELLKRGEEVYNGTCAACHMQNGQGLPPAFPSLVGSAVVTGPVEQHIKLVLNGVPGTAMQAFGPQLGNADIAAVVTYQRNAWGNDTGDVVQPTDIQAAR